MITTKRHRQIAFACVWSDKPRPHELAWIESGGGVGTGDERMRRVAEALAQAEAPLLAEIERLKAGMVDK